MGRSLLQDGWLPQFGGVTSSAPDIIDVRSGTAVHDRFHAEAHHDRVLGADFTYSATITADWTQPHLSAHLQFRISDEGRYGVRLVSLDESVSECRVEFYRLKLEDRRCAENDSVIAHCPLWPEGSDDPGERVHEPIGRFDRTLRTISLVVIAEGRRFVVVFGTPTAVLGRLELTDDGLGIGRFGVYALAATSSFHVTFRDVVATTDPTAVSNFALLYSTPGYDLDGTKRALVRTLNDIDAQDLDATSSTFTVTNAQGGLAIPARRFEAAGPPGSPPAMRRTLGFQFLAADFSDLREPGHYTLDAHLHTAAGVRVLRSAPFEIAPHLVTQRMLWPLSILNAKARRAADDDFRRNWFVDSGRGKWSVGLDGAFVVDRADDQDGAVLKRIFNGGNRPLQVLDFRFIARITIVDGCDAQLQFRVTHHERWAVTLQAGAEGGCRHGGGPGAVRLHREGPAVPGDDHFDPVASHRLDAKPFQLGRAYDVEVRALREHIEVMLDGVRVIDFFATTAPRPGTFALKAWGSTVRFGHMKVWARRVGLSRLAPGVWIPFNRATKLSSQGFKVSKPDFEHNGLPPDSDNDLRFPLAAQQHGFHDCNSFIGEVTSHSVFLSSLMDVWATRAHAATPSQQEELRRAIVTAVLYLNELYEQGGRSGAFAHQEPGRAALADSNQVLTTRFALYGLSSFAEKGSAVDRKLARHAFFRARRAWRWLDENRKRDLVLDSIVTLRLARAAEREREAAARWFEIAQSTAATVLADLAKPGRMANEPRSTLRSIPWFEGVYEAFFRGPFTLSEDQRNEVTSIATQLMALMNEPANGFGLIPQAEDERQPADADPALPARNWQNLADLPLVVRPIPLPSDDPPAPRRPVGDWYISEHFATAAADCVYIGRLAGNRSLERLATGNLYWIFGLNPGIPTTKVVSPPTSGPWSASSFVYNGPGAFARTIEGNRVQTNAAKGWLAPWEKTASSPHRETWAFDPGNTGFQSIVNGHVLRQKQWHYWSHGPHGWVCAETFMLIDGSFIKASLALEDWHSGSTLVRETPYDVTRLRFFDTTHFDRAATLWRFDDPDRTPAAQAWRMATDLAAGKGLGGGRPTGHVIGEHVGVLCLPLPDTTFVDVPLTTIGGTLFPFTDINGTHWAQVGRAAMEIAKLRRTPAGFFTGHVLNERCGWIGLDARLVEIFDIDDNDEAVTQSQWRFDDINAVGWARAARLATDVCIGLGFAGGFFSGHHLPGKRQIVAFRHR